jgi:hypothetical protein
MDIDIEVVPYAEAPWAPRSHGCKFTWAWRIRKDHVNRISGACGGPRRHAEKMAKHAAARIRYLVVGAGDAREFVISPWSHRNSERAGYR